MSDAQPVPASGDGVTILGGGEVLVDRSLVSNDPALVPPPPTAQEKAKAEAESLMRDPDSGYYDREHPKHRPTRERVRMLFDQAHPGVEGDGASSANFYAEPAPAEQPAAPKPAEPPKAAPVDPLDLVPPTAAEYGIPVPADAPPDLTPAMWQTLLNDALTAGLTTREARSWVSFADVKVLRRALEVGYDGLPLESLSEAAMERLRLLGVPRGQALALVEKGLRHLEGAMPRPVVDLGGLEERLKTLMLDPAYRDRFDPKHQRIRAEIRQLADEITMRRPIPLQD